MGLPKDIYQRRIQDAFTVRNWIDNETVETDARSIRTVPVKSKEKDAEPDIVDVDAYFRCTLKFDAKKKEWKILKSEKLKED